MIFFCVHPQPSLFYFFFEYNFTTFCIKPFESSKHVRIFVFRGERMWVNHWITVANWFLNGDDGWSSFGLLRRRKSLVGRRNAIKRTDGQTSTVASSEFVAGSLSSTERCVSHQLLDFFFCSGLPVEFALSKAARSWTWTRVKEASETARLTIFFSSVLLRARLLASPDLTRLGVLFERLFASLVLSVSLLFVPNRWQWRGREREVNKPYRFLLCVVSKNVTKWRTGPVYTWTPFP